MIMLHGFPDASLGYEAVLKYLDLSQLLIIAPFIIGFSK
jgi:hypothetical protein